MPTVHEPTVLFLLISVLRVTFAMPIGVHGLRYLMLAPLHYLVRQPVALFRPVLQPSRLPTAHRARSYTITILPGILMTAVAVLTFAGTYPAQPTNTVFRQITKAAFALYLLMDWVMTGLIAGKLWWAGWKTYYDRNRTAFGRVDLGLWRVGR